MKKIAPLFLAISLIFSSFPGVQAKVVTKKTNISISKKTNFNTKIKNSKIKSKVIQNETVNSNISSLVIPVISIDSDNIIDTVKPSTPPTQVPNVSVSSIKGKFNISSKDIKSYNSNLKEFIAIPITYTTYKNATQFSPKYTINKSGTNIEVIVDDSTLSSSYTESFSSMKKSISIQNIEDNKTKISITCADNADVDVYRTSNNPKISGNSISNRDFLVFSFFDKTKDSSTITTSNNGSTTETQGDSKKPKSKYLITIDPGHGGKQPGACAAGMKEKDLTLDISLKVRDLLLNEGYDIYMIRESDIGVDLYDRATASNILRSDLFMSIHINANSGSSYNGTTVLYNSKAKNPAQKLAEFMRDSIADAIGTKKLRLEDRPHLIVLNSTNSPAILIEAAVLTNPYDAEKLKDDACKQTIANTIASSLNIYFGFGENISSEK